MLLCGEIDQAEHLPKAAQKVATVTDLNCTKPLRHAKTADKATK